MDLGNKEGIDQSQQINNILLREILNKESLMYMNKLRNYFYFNCIEIEFKDICGSYRSGKRRYNISKTQM